MNRRAASERAVDREALGAEGTGEDVLVSMTNGLDGLYSIGVVWSDIGVRERMVPALSPGAQHGKMVVLRRASGDLFVLMCPGGSVLAYNDDAHVVLLVDDQRGMR